MLAAIKASMEDTVACSSRPELSAVSQGQRNRPFARLPAPTSACSTLQGMSSKNSDGTCPANDVGLQHQCSSMSGGSKAAPACSTQVSNARLYVACHPSQAQHYHLLHKARLQVDVASHWQCKRGHCSHNLQSSQLTTKVQHKCLANAK